MPDVRMPDGTIIRNVPEGTTRAQLEARYRARAPKRDTRPTSHPIGFLEGITKVAGNALGYLEKAPGLLNKHGIGGIALGALTGDPSLSSNLKRQSRQALAKAPRKGSGGGRIAGEIVGSIPFGFGPGGVLAQGALQGGIVTDNQNDPVALARDVAIGAVMDKAGEQIGKRVIAPLAERVGRTAPARKAAERVVALVNNVTPGKAKLLPAAPRISKAERTVTRMAPEMSAVRQQVQDAADLNLPFSLADADPRLRNLSGSVARFSSPDARKLATDTFETRARGQAERAIEGIDRHLAPITDINRRAADIIEGGKSVYGPLYDEAYAAPAISSQRLDDILATPAGREAVGRANTIAANEFRDPKALGFAVDEAGNPVLNPAPVDAMNRLDAARQGWDSANSAYEAAVRRQQASLVPSQSLGEVRAAERALAAANAELDGAKAAFAAAPKSTEIQDRSGYTTQSLDYVKRGIDDILEPQRNPISGKLNLDEGGRAINGVQRALLGELDELNPAYKAARAKYAEYAQQASALRRGHQELPKGTLPLRDFNAILARETPSTLPETRRGYATAMADAVDRQRLSANPYDIVYGTPQTQGKVAALFPEGAPRFNRQYDLEREMAATRNEVLGGSQTQPRAVADQLFQNDVANGAADAVIQALTGGGVPGGTKLLGMAAQAIKDRSRLGLMGAQRKADALAPMLFDTSNPQSILDFIDDLARRQAEERARKEAYQRGAGLLGLPLPGLVLGNTP